MIIGMNELKTLIKHISCKWKCKFDRRKCNSNQWLNNNKSQCDYKKRHICKKDYIQNPATHSCENGKYLASVMEYSAITYDEIIESYNEKTKTVPTSFNEKKAI